MEFLQYFGDVFTPWNFTVLFIGVAGGLILGATPGLSPTMSVALLIPFTFHMDPTSALILLGAVYVATVAGGAVSGILVNVPGAPANIATILDGYPMAVQGRSAEALQYCFISSFVGGVIGVFALIFFAPMIADLALRFGPAEMFWVAMLGVTVMGTLSSGSMLKGLFAGAVGLWLATIGYSPFHGEVRFAYTHHLTGGIHIVAALIGLFAIPQVFHLLEQSYRNRGDSAEEFKVERHSLWKAIRFTLSRVKALTIGTLVGGVIGAIPGAGGQIAGLVAYDQIRKFSRDRSRFGKGDPDGVITAESANNAMVGPSLVPLLTLSIPGSPTAAVLLGGLLIHGLFPGPDLFTVHQAITWTFIDSLIVAQVLMLGLGLYLSRLSVYVMRIPKFYVAAGVMILAVIGTYAIQHNFSDVLIMFALGIGMYFAGKLGFAAAPLVLGIILGPIAEQNFMRGMMIADATVGPAEYFLTGTYNIVLIGLCLVSILYGAIAEVRGRSLMARGAPA